MTWSRKHLLGLEGLTRDEICTVLDEARKMKPVAAGRGQRLEDLARDVVRSGQDAKWNQLNSILDDTLMVDEHGNRRKLVVFSEFRDTLTYLSRRVRNRLGRDEAVV